MAPGALPRIPRQSGHRYKLHAHGHFGRTGQLYRASRAWVGAWVPVAPTTGRDQAPPGQLVADIDSRIAYPALPVVSPRLEPAIIEDRDGIWRVTAVRADPSCGFSSTVGPSGSRERPRPRGRLRCSKHPAAHRGARRTASLAAVPATFSARRASQHSKLMPFWCSGFPPGAPWGSSHTGTGSARRPGGADMCPAGIDEPAEGGGGYQAGRFPASHVHGVQLVPPSRQGPAPDTSGASASPTLTALASKKSSEQAHHLAKP